MLQSRVISEASFTFVSIREFMVVNRACFSNSRVYISTSFIFQVSYSFFPDLGQWRAGQIAYALVVPPRD